MGANFEELMRPAEAKIYPKTNIPIKLSGHKAQPIQQWMETVEEFEKKYYLDPETIPKSDLQNILKHSKKKTDLEDIYFYPDHISEYMTRFRKKKLGRHFILEIILTRNKSKSGFNYIRDHAILLFKTGNKKTFDSLCKAMESEIRENMVSPFLPYLSFLKGEGLFKRLLKDFPYFEYKKHPGARNIIDINKTRYLFFSGSQKKQNVVIEIDLIKGFSSHSEKVGIEADYRFLKDIIMVEVESPPKYKIGKNTFRDLDMPNIISNKSIRTKPMRIENQTINISLRIMEGGPAFV